MFCEEYQLNLIRSKIGVTNRSHKKLEQFVASNVKTLHTLPTAFSLNYSV